MNHISIKPVKPHPFTKDLSAWMIMLPSLLLFAFFLWQPLIAGMVISFCETKGFKISGFVGLANYIEVIGDAAFVKALVNSFSYTLWSIALGFVVPIVLAIVINEMVHFKSLFRVSIYFPNVVPGVATVLMWSFMMDPGEGGLFNAVRALAGLGPSQWLQDIHFTIPLIILTMTWKTAGSTALIYIASLQGINQDLYEAASIDGAGLLSRIRYITLPHLYNIARLNLILQIIFVFQVLFEPLVMTGGGPDNASISLMLLNYYYAFRDMHAAKSAAVGVIVSLILLLLTAIYMKASKEKDM